MRTRLVLIGCLAPVLALAAPASAGATEQIESTFLAEYVDPVYTIDQGEIVTFTNHDPFLDHGIVSDDTSGGKPLFEAPRIGHGRTRLLRGAPFLTTGTYLFHSPGEPKMTATLEVTSAGAPLPPDSQPPSATIKVKTPRLRVLTRRRMLKLRFDPSEVSDAAITVRAAGLTLATAERTYLSSGVRTLILSIPRSTASKLARRARRLRAARHRRFLVIGVSAALGDVAGNQGTARGSRRIRLPIVHRPMPRRKKGR